MRMRTTELFEKNVICPMTDSQKGVYLECINEPDSLQYNVPMLCRFSQRIDAQRLVAAVKAVVRSHGALHMNARAPEGVPSLIYREREIDVAEKAVEDVEQEISAFIRPFDLENEPLCRFELLHTPEGDALLYDIHHLVFDGTSARVLSEQILRCYQGEECPKETLTILDAAEIELAKKDTDEYRAAQAYFAQKLADCDAKPVPDQTAEGVRGVAFLTLDVGEKFTAGEVLAYAKAHKVSANALFLGAFSYALAKFNGAQESAFATAYHGRYDHRFDNTVGMFVKTLPFYYHFDETMRVEDFLQTVYEDYYQAKRHAIVPFGELKELYGASTDVSFIYQDVLLSGAERGGLTIETELPNTGDAPVSLDLMVRCVGNSYALLSRYQSALYTEGLVRSFAALYCSVVRGMLTAQTLGDIALTDEADEALLDSFNRTEADYDADTTVVALFRAQANKTPDNICLAYDGKRFTYREVDELTDSLAAHLIKNGVGKEKVVGVLIPRSEHMLLCSLGVLKAGGAYLPLDPTYPPERLNLMVQDSGAMLLLSTPELAGIITDKFTGARMMADGIFTLPPCDVELPTSAPHDLFVMLYTSGSTGRPKGVMYEHANALVTVQWVKKYFAMDETSRVVSYASYGFDAHVFDVYSAVTSGAELHIIPEDIRLDFPALRDYFNKNGITHAVMTTQIGRQFSQLGGLKTLKHLSVAGEKLTPLDVPDGFALYNLYGPTEGSVVTSAFRIDRRYQDIPIGKPVDNLKAYVVDSRGKRLNVGAVGELWIAGPHVTRGYLNRPEKTAEAYGNNPFSTEAGYGRVYRTGDIVRLMPDGNLQFVGRRDQQAKVRGFRVELTEIEEVVRRFPGIKDATVAAFDDPAGGKFIAAYVVSDNAVSPDALSDFIRAEKPYYMVPAVIMQLDAIPLTQNQKVNRRALPVPERKLDDIVPPENDTQKRILDLVAEVVGHIGFGVTTNLYDAGLTSIGAVKLNVALADAFGVPMKIADFKTNDTVKKLEQLLASRVPQGQYAMQSDYPITQTQSGIFVECMALSDTTAYNIPVLLRIGAGVDTSRLANAVRAAVNAHPYVKTTLFTDAQGNVRAKRNDSAEVNVPIVRCDALPEKLMQPYALINAPLYRLAIYETAAGNYLYMDFHHIICDGTSETVLLRDIDRAYAGQALTPERFSGFEAALAEESARSGEAYSRAKAYWDALLVGCNTACMPQKTPENKDGGAGFVRLIGDADAPVILAHCAKSGITPNALFNAAFSFTLARFTNQEGVSYATIYSGRNDSRLADAVTMLVRTIPVCAEVNDDTTTSDFVRAMQSQLVDSMANDAVSFAELSHDYGVNADLIFIYQGADFRFDSLCGEKAELIELSPESAKAPISLNVYLNDDRFEYTLEYRREQYSAPFAESLIHALTAAVKAFTQQVLLKDISLLTESAETVYDTLNASDATVEPLCCHQRFERCTAEKPDSLAVVAAGEKLTYAQLNARANTMAHALRSFGVEREKIVGVVLERSCDVLTCELAVMKAGGAFLPMLPSYPDERIDYCLTNAENPCVITTEKIKRERPSLFAEEKPYRTLTVEQLCAGDEAENLGLEILPSQLAYCIYTSGSTGKPKGVMIEHHSLTNHIATHWEEFAYYRSTETDAALACSSISFDMSLFELLPALCFGKTVCIATEDEIHDPIALRDLMLANNVGMMTATPSFINNMLTMPGFDKALSQLKTLVVGAEAFLPSLYGALRDAAPNLQIINGYGPTECTICCSVKELHSGEGITIGRPTGNIKMYVADRCGHALPPYTAGELILCGEGVSRGYVNLPEKSKASFFTFRGLPAYHSGDLVHLTANAEIAFGGRIDNQVKLRGFRVELDEIEKVMCTYVDVKQSKVLVRNNGSEDYLVGFFTAESGIDTDALTAHLKSRLAEYMVPAVLMQLDAMPLTPNGKIDKNGFPQVQKSARKTEGHRKAKKSLEQRLCEIFGTVLGLDDVFADDSFFELGGTSLSASKVTMLLMSEGIEAKYGDIFDHPTPEDLAEFIEQRDGFKEAPQSVEDKQETFTYPALRWNQVKYTPEVKREPLGNVLLTGAVGFLGTHILRELIEHETGHIYCLVRRGRHESAEIRLRTMLIYYFSNSFEDAIRNRITLLEADITDASLGDMLADVPFDTVINCAACVKHFSDSDILEQINVHGVENLIDICMKKNAKLVQISTVSVPGIHTKESYEKQIRMHENELFVIDDMDNKYGISKYHAELKMLDAIDRGLRGKIIRCGNLMGRHSDGEFQANLETNMFMSGIRGFATMGKYPISHMTDPMRFSPVDCTARAIVLLAGVNDKFTAFNCDNRYGFDEMKIIDACNRNGIKIVPAADEEYYAEFQQKLGDDRVNARLHGLAAYDIKGGHAVDTDNLFTTNVLYRIGFSWPLVDDAYLDRAIHSVMTMDYFAMDELDED